MPGAHSMPVQKLISIASPALAQEAIPALLGDELQGDERLRGELREMLAMKNGFYVFEGALHVFPWIQQSAHSAHLSLQDWNDTQLWRCWYQGQCDGLLSFAEDAFGGQFAISKDEVVSFDPESGEVEAIASSIAEWAGALLLNYRQLTGYPVAKAWQLTNGAIPEGSRLLPKIPFILGGQYEKENLFAVDAVKGMRYRGDLWQQISDLPDGAQVRIKALPLL